MSFETETRTGTEVQTMAVAQELAKHLQSGDVILLKGELGAGKTHFVKGLARGLDHDPAQVQSPTFTIIHEYRTRGAELPLFHFDCYRLKSSEELLDVGIEHYLEEYGVCCIEWPELAEPFLPEEIIEVQIEHEPNDQRKITIKKG